MCSLFPISFSFEFTGECKALASYLYLHCTGQLLPPSERHCGHSLCPGSNIPRTLEPEMQQIEF